MHERKQGALPKHEGSSRVICGLEKHSCTQEREGKHQGNRAH